MEARVSRTLFALVLGLFLLSSAESSQAATYRTPNFIVHAPTEEFAKRVGDEAERFRKEMAVLWAGEEFPNWSAPCPIRVKVGQIGAGGATTFSFQNGEVFGWNMTIQGTEERILDSVLPHEITHTILACRYRRPIPRWADEGICTLVEHESERRRQTLLLGNVMRQGSLIPLRSLLAMTEYPQNQMDVMKLYAQGYSLTDYLVQQGGRETFLRFLGDAMRHGGWDQALSAHYGVNSVDVLEKKWNQWVTAGSPALKQPEAQALAVNERWRRDQQQASEREPELFRGQSPDSPVAPLPVSNVPADSASAATAVASAPLFGGSQPEHQRDRTSANAPHQAARSRNHLQLPILNSQAQAAEGLAQQRTRNQLELTREEFQAPRTPVSGQAPVQPFSGGGSRDPFLP